MTETSKTERRAPLWQTKVSGGLRCFVVLWLQSSLVHSHVRFHSHSHLLLCVSLSLSLCAIFRAAPTRRSNTRLKRHQAFQLAVSHVMRRAQDAKGDSGGSCGVHRSQRQCDGVNRRVWHVYRPTTQCVGCAARRTSGSHRLCCRLPFDAP